MSNVNENDSVIPAEKTAKSGTRTLEFNVTICMGGGDGGETCVEVEVTDEEYEILKECCREDGDISDYEELDDLYQRIIGDSEDESKAEDPNYIDGDEDDEDYYDPYECASYIVYLPNEVYAAVEAEDAENGEHDDE